jgi:hypothetical protein
MLEEIIAIIIQTIFFGRQIYVRKKRIEGLRLAEDKFFFRKITLLRRQILQIGLHYDFIDTLYCCSKNETIVPESQCLSLLILP